MRWAAPFCAAFLGAFGVTQVAWAAKAEDETALQAYLKATSKVSYDYQVGWADLNADGLQDAVVRFTSQEFCGSGGCSIQVLQRTRTGFRKRGSTTITWLPIEVLPSRHHGWRDLSMFTAGGGVLPGYRSSWAFNGRKYPFASQAGPLPKGLHGRAIIDKDAPVHSLVLP